ncbi:MAG: hypothetical protein KDA57_23720, partial [Planctomycetales bacterium]|nr:hypothetical protein [Planctomycetales bacterium]
ELIASGKKEAARALNQAVRVLGDSLDPAVVINRVRSDYGINESTEDLSLMSEYDITFVAGRYHYDRFTYEKLEDAVRYAKQQRKKI